MEMAEARSGVQNSTKKSFCDGNNVDVGLLLVPWKGKIIIIKNELWKFFILKQYFFVTAGKFGEGESWILFCRLNAMEFFISS